MSEEARCWQRDCSLPKKFYGFKTNNKQKYIISSNHYQFDDHSLTAKS
jgi:hypothetical protein